MSREHPTHEESCTCSGCHWSNVVDGARAPLLAEIEKLKAALLAIVNDAAGRDDFEVATIDAIARKALGMAVTT